MEHFGVFSLHPDYILGMPIHQSAEWASPCFFIQSGPNSIIIWAIARQRRGCICAAESTTLWQPQHAGEWAAGEWAAGEWAM